jgi:hypothetical protein
VYRKRKLEYVRVMSLIITKHYNECSDSLVV